MNGKMVVAALSLFVAGLFAPPLYAQGDNDGKKELDKIRKDQLQKQIRRDDWLVTMEFKDAKVSDVVAEFRRQVRVSILLDASNIPEEFRVDEFIVKDVPFRTAFDAFLKKAGLSIDEDTPTLIRISRPPRVTFNFKDADVRAVLDMIARIANANIVVAPEVKGTISLNMHDVPWTDVLDAVVKTLNFTTVREKFGIIRIIHPDELRKQMETRVFPLKFIQFPEDFRATIESGKFIHGEPPRVQTQAEQRLKDFFLKPTLEAVLTGDARGNRLGRLDYDPKTNAFVVTDVKPVLDKIDEILKILDVEPAQVIVDVKFISTINEDLMEFGTNFFFGGTQEDGISVRTQPIPPQPAAGGLNAGKITSLPFGLGHEQPSGSQFFLTEYDMTATFRAFRRDQYSRLIQEPTIAALDGEPATIFIGEEIRYAEQNVTTNQFGGLEITLGEARSSPVSVGFQLYIMPHIIKESNKVMMTVIPTNQVLSGTTSPLPGFERFELAGVGPNGSDVTIDLPRIQSTTLVTKLILESGKTAVLGGLVVERTNIEDKKVPILGDLPIIGYLFKQSQDSVRRENLLIFITPRIVRLDADNERVRSSIRARNDALRRDFRRMQGKEGNMDSGDGKK